MVSRSFVRARALLRIAAAITIAAGCGDGMVDARDDAGVDHVIAETLDGGSAGVDASQPDADAGEVLDAGLDAGLDVPDAGEDGPDSGDALDAGEDAGEIAADAGADAADAGADDAGTDDAGSDAHDAGVESPDAGGPPCYATTAEVDDLIDRLARAECGAVIRCNQPELYVRTLVPDVETCAVAWKSRLAAGEVDTRATVYDAQSVLAALALKKGTARLLCARVAGCLEALAQWVCGNGPIGPRPWEFVCPFAVEGTVPQGGTCRADAECVSRRCSASCGGICLPPVDPACPCAATEICVSDGAGALRCEPKPRWTPLCPDDKRLFPNGSGHCQPLPTVPIGNSCTTSCGPGASCVNRVCRALFGEGEACEGGVCGSALACVLADDGVQRCKPFPREGERCGSVNPTESLPFCAPGSFCGPDGVCITGPPYRSSWKVPCPPDTNPAMLPFGIPSAENRVCMPMLAEGATCGQTAGDRDRGAADCAPGLACEPMADGVPHCRRLASGDACRNGSSCPAGEGCFGDLGGTCAPLPREGEACVSQWGDAEPCADSSLTCVPTSASTGVCKRLKRLGEPCESLLDCGNVIGRWVCDVAGTKTCIERPKAAEPCVDWNGIGLCDALSAYCDRSTSPPTCRPFKAEGTPCDFGDECGRTALLGDCHPDGADLWRRKCRSSESLQACP